MTKASNPTKSPNGPLCPAGFSGGDQDVSILQGLGPGKRGYPKIAFNVIRNPANQLGRIGIGAVVDQGEVGGLFDLEVRAAEESFGLRRSEELCA